MDGEEGRLRVNCSVGTAVAGLEDLSEPTVRGILTYSQSILRVWQRVQRGQRWSQRRLPRAQAWHDLRSVGGLGMSGAIGSDKRCSKG